MEVLSAYDPDEKSSKEKCHACGQKIERPVRRDDLRRVMTVFKMAQGFDKEDKSWDRTYYPKYSPIAKQLIDFLGSWEDAADCIQQVMEESAAAGYRIYKFQTVLEKAQKWKLDKMERDAGRK